MLVLKETCNKNAHDNLRKSKKIKIKQQSFRSTNVREFLGV